MADQRITASYSSRYTFTAKEQDALTGLHYFGARYYDARISLWYGVDPLAEELPSQSAFNYCYNNPIILIDPDGAKPTPRQAALIAAHSYGDANVKLEGGWLQSTRTYGLQFGVSDKGTGLRSMLYERMTDGKIEYVYATVGTENLKDWTENGMQAAGASAEYAESIDNARSLNKSIGEEELTFVGHSQGGGEAAANSYATGREAITFNAAGVSQLTLSNNDVNAKKGSMNNKINAYIMTSDPLNLLQNSSKALGLIMPNVDGKRNYIEPQKASQYYNGHSINNFVELLKDE